jgi:hypothetical protein
MVRELARKCAKNVCNNEVNRVNKQSLPQLCLGLAKVIVEFNHDAEFTEAVVVLVGNNVGV